MKIRLLTEGARKLRLFHGTSVNNLPGILKYGLTQGQMDRSFFAFLGKHYAYIDRSNQYGLVEIIISSSHHHLVGSFELVDVLRGYSIRATDAGIEQIPVSYPECIDDRLRNEIEQFKDEFGVDIVHSYEFYNDEKYAGARRRWFTLNNKYMRACKLIENQLEFHLPLPIDFVGNPKITGIYIIQNDIVSSVLYNKGGSLVIGQEIPRGNTSRI